jgi:RNA polymerase sigma-70 factor (ECF subfamily)
MDNIKQEFSNIYDQYIDKIYRFVFLKVSSQEVAEDLTSDTFLKVWEVYQNDKNKIQNCQAFLYKIANNLVIDYYRVKGRSKVVSTEDKKIADPKVNIEKGAALSSDMDNIKIALADMNEDYQNVIIWHYLDGVPINTVAQMMDRSEEATRVLLHRALKSLKDQLNQDNQNRIA